MSESGHRMKNANKIGQCIIYSFRLYKLLRSYFGFIQVATRLLIIVHFTYIFPIIREQK